MIRSIRARPWAGALSILLLLSGCSSLPPAARLQSAPGLPAQHELTATPFFPQQRYQCGPAALATLLHPHEPEAEPERLREQVYLPARQGSLQPEMVAAVRRYGLLPYPFEADLERLLREVAAGRPVLVLQNLGLDWLPRWHYAVVVGYDLEQREVVLRSGTDRRRTTPFGVFENTWARSHHWALLVLPPGELPLSAEPLPLLQQVHALEKSGLLQLAGRYYQAAAERWPDEPLVWMGLGNYRYGQGDGSGAEAAYRRVIALKGDYLPAWNNLAYVLLEQACPASARRALECALAVVPNDAALRQSVAELGERLQGEDGPGCRPLSCSLGQ